ncbi:Transmembrane and coiled-coil domains protein 1 [Exaiptasia diaphana]|nr:Transmembrane and coiled-coil domains protein 1 [Exaiptasia diaphana]
MMSRSPVLRTSGSLAVPRREGISGSSGSLSDGRPKSPAFKSSPSPKRKPGHWFRRKDGTKSDSEMQDSDGHDSETKKHFKKVLAQIKEGPSMAASRKRSKTAEVLPSSSSSGGTETSPTLHSHLSSSGGSTELGRGRSNTALSITDEENIDLDSEYLESTEGTQNQAKVKINFEKKNQKTNTTIAQLQRKLQKYHKALVDLEENGTVSSKVMAKEVLKGVKDGVKGAVSKPLEIANLIKNKFGSSENVSSSPGPGSII